MSFGRLLLLPIFLFKLFSTLLLEAVHSLTGISLKQHWFLVGAILFFLFALGYNMTHSPTLFQRFSATFFPAPIPVTLNTSDKELQEQIEYWERLRSLQPTHRDILLNLSLLYQAKGDQAKANEYLLQAKELDPNNPVFTKLETQ